MIVPTVQMESTVRVAKSSLTVMQDTSVILGLKPIVMKIRFVQQVIIVLEVLFSQ